jgi:hypothetical protein
MVVEPPDGVTVIVSTVGIAEGWPVEKLEGEAPGGGKAPVGGGGAASRYFKRSPARI